MAEQDDKPSDNHGDADADADERYEAQDGTVFDTRYKGAGDVYVADDGTVIVKPKAE